MEIESSRPALFEINTRAYLNELGIKLNKKATLDDIPDSLLLDLANKGFDFVWLLGVWQIGDTGRDISRSNQSWQRSFRDCLCDLSQKDISGSHSPFNLTRLIPSWEVMIPSQGYAIG